MNNSVDNKEKYGKQKAVESKKEIRKCIEKMN